MISGLISMYGGLISPQALLTRTMSIPAVFGIGYNRFQSDVDNTTQLTDAIEASASTSTAKLLSRSNHKVLLGANGREYQEGDLITLDATHGVVYSGLAPCDPKPIFDEDFHLLFQWIDQIKSFDVFAIARNEVND